MAAPKGRAGRQLRANFERLNPERFRSPLESAPNLSPRTQYHLRGWTEPEGQQAEIEGQGTLFEHPHMQDPIPRWEDLPTTKRSQYLKRIAQYGVTPESAKRAYGSQLDRAMEREQGQHQNFYTASGNSNVDVPMPRQAVFDTAQAFSPEDRTKPQFPPHLAAAAHAITSPKTAVVAESALGEVTLPNDEAAREALSRAHDENHVPRSTRALSANVSKAADAIGRVMNVGQRIQDVWKPGTKNKKGEPIIGGGTGDKTRTYYNALVDPASPEGNRFVSDSHSGVGGMAPHLAGTPFADDYLRTAGVHSFHDWVARQVHAERGLSSTTRGQSAQWGQEKHEQGQSFDVNAMQPENESGRDGSRHMNPNQAALF